MLNYSLCKFVFCDTNMRTDTLVRGVNEKQATWQQNVKTKVIVTYLVLAVT